MNGDKHRILFTGDIHLGRHPSRIPEALDGPQFSPRTVWMETVREAVDRDVDAVLLSGDVVDRENRYFEAYGAFEEGAVSLAEAGISVVAVAGNHDFDVLPRMIEELDLDAVSLLGDDGRWERTTIERDGEPLLCVDGWSFPDEHVLTSPFDEYDLDPGPEVPVIGLLHADLDARGSDYAPVMTDALRETHASAWLLGHIHKPILDDGTDPLVLYPGSLQPLDPGEPGAHGPWMLSVDESGITAAEQIPIANVRYDEFEIDVEGIEDPMEVPSKASDAFDEYVRYEADSGAVEVLLARVRLTGRAPCHADLVDRQQALVDQLELKRKGISICIESIEVDTRPAVDLQRLADDETPVGYLAELLLTLEDVEVDEAEAKAATADGGRVVDRLDDDHARAVEQAFDAMQEAYNASAYTDLRREGLVDRPNRDDAVEMLVEQARVLLDVLLDQQEGGTA